LAKALVGQTAWSVQLGWGSFLTVEFGTAIEEDGETHGEWHLWLRMCDWRVETPTEVRCCSGDDPDYIRGRLGDGYWGEVRQISVEEPGLDLEVVFSSGHVVRAFISSSTEDDQWMLYTPNKMTLIAHGGGRYEYLPQ
jgi:hypothetical protein